MRNLTIWILLLCSLTYCFGGTGEKTPHVWVVGGDGIVEYEPLTWSELQRLAPPVGIPEHSDRLQIVPSGAMLFVPDSQAGPGFPGNAADGRAAWIWDGERSSSLGTGCHSDVVSTVECRESVRESCPGIAMSYDGRKLFWFANEFETVKEVDGPDVSVSTKFIAWRTELDGSGRTAITDFSFPPCVCETGACPETCPQADVWFPADGIDDCFIVLHFIEGQLGSTSMGSFVYRNQGRKWSALKFPQIFDAVLDAGSGGETVLYTIRDSGCCGWDNDSNDRTVLSSKGIVRVIFDERERFSNSNYDVSFYTSKALLSPDESHIAVNIAATQRRNDEIRLSSTGEENPDELVRIREALKTMPSIEVIRASGPESPLLSLPNVSLVGWLNEKEILAVRGDVLVRCNVGANACSDTPVRVQKDAAVFIR